MTYLIPLCQVLVIACLLLRLRVEIVLRARERGRDITVERNRRLMKEGKYDLMSWSEYKNAGSYTSMVFNLRKWKFEHFFPELKEIAL